MSRPIIQVSNISKKYRIGVTRPYHTLRDSLVQFAKRPLDIFKQRKVSADGLMDDEFWALKDISFDVIPGEVLGIIGRNGAGKSTLLKILSRITPPTSGEVILRGRVASLLEVGTGFNPELTGRENIFLNGAILGMKNKEIRKKFNEIVDFSEIEKFLDTPVKYFSSGMYMRLAFAIAAHLQPEILIVDEVLAVGDIQFQRKCLGKMNQVAKEGRTVIFVSHNIATIRQLCSKAILLDKGEMTSIGDIVSVIEYYLSQNSRNNLNKSEIYFKKNSEKEFQVLSIRLLNGKGETKQQFNCDEPVFIELNCISRVAVPGLYGYMNLINKEGTIVLVSDTCDVLLNQLDLLQPGRYRTIIKIPARTIGHGDYLISFNFTSTQGVRNFNIDTLNYVCGFHLDDNSTERGNKRDGYLSTLLKWEIV